MLVSVVPRNGDIERVGSLADVDALVVGGCSGSSYHEDRFAAIVTALAQPWIGWMV